MKTVFALLAALLATAAHAQQEVVPLVLFSAKDALFARASGDIESHPCQPLKGDRVTVLSIDKRPSGNEVATVRVESGQCRGQEGLASVSNLARTDTPLRASPAASSAPAARPRRSGS